MPPARYRIPKRKSNDGPVYGPAKKPCKKEGYEYNTETKLTAQASTAVTALNRYSRAQVRDRAASISKLRPEFNEIQWKRQHRARRSEMLAHLS